MKSILKIVSEIVYILVLHQVSEICSVHLPPVPIHTTHTPSALWSQVPIGSCRAGWQ